MARCRRRRGRRWPWPRRSGRRRGNGPRSRRGSRRCPSARRRRAARRAETTDDALEEPPGKAAREAWPFRAVQATSHNANKWCEASPSAHEALDDACDPVRVQLDIRLPEPTNAEAESTQGQVVPPVSGDVAADLGHPIGGVVPSREPSPPTGEVSAVPEVPINEHRETSVRKDEVRTTRKRGDVPSWPEPLPLQGAEEQRLTACARLAACASCRRACSRRARLQTGETRRRATTPPA